MVVSAKELEIAFGLVLFPSGLAIAGYGYKRIGDALELVIDRKRRAWWKVCFWQGFALLGAGIAAGGVTYALSVCAPGN